MTTLAIIGSGIAGRSLLYNLAKDKKAFDQIYLFNSDLFTPACSLNSTAVVAPRGITTGHSNLGDLLAEGYLSFKAHVEEDSPLGVQAVSQITAASIKLEAFRARYGQVTPSVSFENLRFKKQSLVTSEAAFLITPTIYLDWLLSQAEKSLPIKKFDDLITSVEGHDSLLLKTQNQNSYEVDKLVFAAGAYNSFWKSSSSDHRLKNSRFVQGAYLEFTDVCLGSASFSLTYDSQNLIYNEKDRKLLLGSSSIVTGHILAPEKKLKVLYEGIQASLELTLPAFELGTIKVGSREKAPKREPYMINEGNKFFLGGLYKNGFTLGLTLTRSFSRQYL